MTSDQLSKAHETIENPMLERASYMSQVEELEETISGLHNTTVDLKTIPCNKVSEEDISKPHSKTLELKDENTALNKEVERLIKVETVSAPSSETNDNPITVLEGLLDEKANKTE